MIEEILTQIIQTIVTIYFVIIIFGGLKHKWFAIYSIIAFLMIITILLLGRIVFAIW